MSSSPARERVELSVLRKHLLDELPRREARARDGRDRCRGFRRFVERVLRRAARWIRTARADAALASALGTGDVDFGGLELAAVDATVEREIPGGAIVEVTSELSGYGVGQERQAPGTATARLKLVLTQRGWLVERILPPA